MCYITPRAAASSPSAAALPAPPWRPDGSTLGLLVLTDLLAFVIAIEYTKL